MKWDFYNLRLPPEEIKEWEESIAESRIIFESLWKNIQKTQDRIIKECIDEQRTTFGRGTEGAV